MPHGTGKWSRGETNLATNQLPQTPVRSQRSVKIWGRAGSERKAAPPLLPWPGEPGAPLHPDTARNLQALSKLNLVQ